jgi:hypothetical protein
MELAIAGDVAREGETVEGILAVECDKPLSIKAMRASLVGIEHSQAHSHHEEAHFAGEPLEMDVPPIAGSGFSQTFALPCKLAGPPTRRGTNFHIDWFVQVELDVPWAKNPKIRVPIRLLQAVSAAAPADDGARSLENSGDRM